MMENHMLAAKRRLLELEERIPWSAVKKKWTPKRTSWVNSVQLATTFAALTKRLCMLEAALKQESFDPSWSSRRDEWKTHLTECAPGHEVEALLQACAGLEAGVAWDRVRDDVLALEQQQQAAHAALVLAGGAVDGAGAAEGGFGAVPFGSKRGLEGGYTGVPKPAGRMGAIGLGKRPRALVSPTMTPRAAGGGAGGAPGCSSVSHAEMRRRSALTEMCMRGEAEWDSVLTEATVPTREQLLSGPPAERVPAASLRVLALLESAGVGGQHEGAVVTQLLELIHRHVAGILADATACCVHRVEAPDFAVAAAEGACVLASDVHMAVELDLVTLAHVAPPPRDVLAATGCCAINALPLPLFPDDGLGVVLPPQAERLASLRN